MVYLLIFIFSCTVLLLLKTWNMGFFLNKSKKIWYQGILYTIINSFGISFFRLIFPSMEVGVIHIWAFLCYKFCCKFQQTDIWHFLWHTFCYLHHSELVLIVFLALITKAKNDTDTKVICQILTDFDQTWNCQYHNSICIF